MKVHPFCCKPLVVGRWSVAAHMVKLDGFGRIDGDALPNPVLSRFLRTFTYDVTDFSPILTAKDDELPGWSLLGWAGLYSYMGWEFVFNPDGGWLPQSIQDIDGMIEKGLR